MKTYKEFILEAVSKKPTAYVTVGLPGSGKSTIAKHMAAQGNTDQHEFDKSRKVLGLGPADFTNALAAHTFSGAQTSANQGRNTVLSNTSIPRVHRQDAINKLKDAGYEDVKPILAPGSIKAALRRNSNRTGTKPGEGAVPQFVMNRMIQGMKNMKRSERAALRSEYKKAHREFRFTKPAMRRSGALRRSGSMGSSLPSSNTRSPRFTPGSGESFGISGIKLAT